MPGIRRRHFCHPTSFQRRGCENGRSTEARQVDRERKTPSTQVPRGAKQIVIPMTQQQYDDIWHDADSVRSFIEQTPGRLRSCFRRASTKAIACTALGVSL